MTIAKHKVFISYYHQDDQGYKNRLLTLNNYYNIFEDYSVHEDEIDDTGMTSEQIRREIRDNYIQDATVLVLLCGENTKHRKHIDWEIHAAMYDSDVNPKMGILVINLPAITSEQTMIAFGTDEQNLMAPFSTWTPLDKSRTSLEEKHPYLPSRIITNLMRDDVQISLVNWDVVANNPDKLKQLIDNAFERRKSNNYDHSEPLRKNNS